MRNVILYAPHLNRDIRGLLNVLPHPRIYTGESTANGADGCLQSHQAVVREALRDCIAAVAVYEDDCQFTEHFNYDDWCDAAEWARRVGYDVLCGGSTRTYDEGLAAHGFVEVSMFHSAHCVVYFASGYEKILKHAVQPYDLSLGRECGLRCVLALPFVAVQRPSFSGILQQDVDYVPLYAAHERELMRRFSWRLPSACRR